MSFLEQPMITTAQAKSSGPNSGTACLVSWKEIAAYFKREVRTLQRWEKTEGLPVRRHYHSKLATVYAYSSELDQWRLSRETQFDPLDSRWRHATSARPESSLPSLKAAPDAYISYLKGRYCWAWRTTERFNKAIDYFEQAIEQDPKCALAHAGLADTYNSLWFFGGSGIQGNVAKARQAALKAIELDEGLAEAHASLAYTLMFDWDWGGAEREFRKAIQLNPACGTARHWYADFLAAVGRHQDALDDIQQARGAQALSLNTHA